LEEAATTQLAIQPWAMAGVQQQRVEVEALISAKQD
jgi:hypothetical protein